MSTIAIDSPTSVTADTNLPQFPARVSISLRDPDERINLDNWVGINTAFRATINGFKKLTGYRITAIAYQENGDILATFYERPLADHHDECDHITLRITEDGRTTQEG